MYSGDNFLRRSWSCERRERDDGSNSGFGRGVDDVVGTLERTSEEADSSSNPQGSVLSCDSSEAVAY